MKKTILALITLFILSGCGDSTDEVIAEVIIDESNIEKVEDVEEPIIEVITEYDTYYTIPMYSKDIDSYGLQSDYGNYAVYITDVDGFDVSGVTATDKDGIINILFTNTYDSDEYGIKAKYRFDTLKAELDAKYQMSNDFEWCTGSSYICGDENYSYSLYTEDRVRTVFYHHNENTIMLSISANGVYGTFVKLGIESPLFSELN